jgi:REP element-mobilizing transposase RayT
VTACTKGRACLFGEVVSGELQLSEVGRIVTETWAWLTIQYPYVELDVFVIMPNHIHGIIVVQEKGGRGRSQTAPTKRKSLGRLIGAMKTVSTKSINQRRGTPGAAVWQRNYYEHVIRSDNSLNRIREYILDNPGQWNFDRENPAMPRRRAFLPQDEPWRV